LEIKEKPNSLAYFAVARVVKIEKKSFVKLSPGRLNGSLMVLKKKIEFSSNKIEVEMK